MGEQETKVESSKPIVNLPLTIDDLDKVIGKYQDLQNKIWHDTIKLVITLSSSILVLSLAFVEKVFTGNIPLYIILSWLFLFRLRNIFSVNSLFV